MFGMGSASASIVISVARATLIIHGAHRQRRHLPRRYRRDVGLDTVSGAITATSVRGGVNENGLGGSRESKTPTATWRSRRCPGDVTATADRRSAGSSLQRVKAEITHSTWTVSVRRVSTMSGQDRDQVQPGGRSGVRARTVSSHLDCGFQLRNEQSSKRRLRGRVGDGVNRLVASTVSGDVALLRRTRRWRREPSLQPWRAAAPICVGARRSRAAEKRDHPPGRGQVHGECTPSAGTIYRG